MQSEIWKDVPGFPGYQVSNAGHVKCLEMAYYCGNKHSKRIRTEHIMSPVSLNGYLRIALTKGGKRISMLIHRLVALAFIPNPDGLPQINHKNEIKTDNRVENLEWCTAKYNNRYGNRRFLVSSKNTNGKKSTPVICLETNIVYPSQAQAQRETGIRQSDISACCLRRGKIHGYSFRKI